MPRLAGLGLVRWIVGSKALRELVLGLPETFLKLTEAPSDSPHELRDLGAAEQDEDDQSDDQQVLATEHG